ncbi:hypothetical protein PIB30_056431 [Stylosanthes scabra]|uniref:Uncharacterized protein n=1 Tax=Stylosanthes scabra TaxID=79078 RepID=A0ABU6SKJ2_9FABA|nr:hypothetical protein [Stylosanthes scabra]
MARRCSENRTGSAGSTGKTENWSFVRSGSYAKTDWYQTGQNCEPSLHRFSDRSGSLNLGFHRVPKEKQFGGLQLGCRNNVPCANHITVLQTSSTANEYSQCRRNSLEDFNSEISQYATKKRNLGTWMHIIPNAFRNFAF